jgi:hypothetical protein
MKRDDSGINLQYPELLTELGHVVGLLQDALAPYDGAVRLEKIYDACCGSSPVYVVNAQLFLSYDPGAFHLALMEARQRAEAAAVAEQEATNE